MIPQDRQALGPMRRPQCCQYRARVAIGQSPTFEGCRQGQKPARVLDEALSICNKILGLPERVLCRELDRQIRVRQ